MVTDRQIRKTDFDYRFGGTNGVECSNELWMYYLQFNTWIQPPVTGNVPCPRERHAATVVDDVMYIFGGRDQQGHFLNDLAALRLKDCQWRIFTVMGLSPSPRAGHTLTAVRQQLILAGGIQNTEFPPNADLDFMYTLDVKQLQPTWASSSSTIRCLPCLTSGSATLVKRRGSDISEISTSSHSACSITTDITSIRDVRVQVFFLLCADLLICFC